MIYQMIEAGDRLFGGVKVGLIQKIGVSVKKWGKYLESQRKCSNFVGGKNIINLKQINYERKQII